MKEIHSVQNELIKETVKLKTAKGRKQAGKFVVEGERSCRTFIEQGFVPSVLFATESMHKVAHTLFLENSVLVPGHVMKKISSATTPSGLLAVFEIPPVPDPKHLSSGLVLVGINNPGNMGTLIRSCAAFGYKSIVVVEGCDPYCPKTIQATAGTLPFVQVFKLRWQELLAYKKDFELVALVVQDGKPPQLVTNAKTLFVIGSEAHGIRPEWLAQCDQKISIPMPGKTESLNASVAGSIALAIHSMKQIQNGPCQKGATG